MKRFRGLQGLLCTANIFRKAKLWSTAQKTFVGNAFWLILSRPNLDEEETGQGVEAGAASGSALRPSQFKIHKGKKQIKTFFFQLTGSVFSFCRR